MSFSSSNTSAFFSFSSHTIWKPKVNKRVLNLFSLLVQKIYSCTTWALSFYSSLVMWHCTRSWCLRNVVRKKFRYTQMKASEKKCLKIFFLGYTQLSSKNIVAWFMCTFIYSRLYIYFRCDVCRHIILSNIVRTQKKKTVYRCDSFLICAHFPHN